jgi:uncharacterized protein YbbC (DUF1343 family)
VRVYPTRFQPTSSHFAGTTVNGVRFVITDREAFDSVRLGLEVASALQHLYPGQIDFSACKSLIGSKAVLDALRDGIDPERIQSEMEGSVRDFVMRRKNFLLYQ